MGKRLWYVLAMILLCTTGCQKPVVVPDPTPTPGPEETNYFKADIKDLYAFGAMGVTGAEVFYETDISGWAITPSEEWCRIVVEKERFIIMADDYTPYVNPDGSGGYLYTEPRTCTVELVAGSVFGKTFTVLQESMTAISIPLAPIFLSSSGESKDVLIINNCYNWTASTDASWITLKKKDSSTLTVTSEARPASETTPRQATVLVVSELDPEVRQVFTVADADAEINGEDYNYGDHTDWD